MIKKSTLFGPRYKFKHLDIEALKEDDKGNVLAFSATFVHVRLNDKLSPGAIEINKTLWDQQSTKRPKGFLVLKTEELSNGTTVSVMISEDWFFETLSKEERRAFEDELKEKMQVTA